MRGDLSSHVEELGIRALEGSCTLAFCLEENLNIRNPWLLASSLSMRFSLSHVDLSFFQNLSSNVPSPVLLFTPIKQIFVEGTLFQPMI